MASVFPAKKKGYINIHSLKQYDMACASCGKRRAARPSRPVRPARPTPRIFIRKKK